MKAGEIKDKALFTAYDDYNPNRVPDAQFGLLTAVLLNALNDLKKEGHIARRAEEYLLSNEEDHVFSFLSICDYLNVSPEAVLKSVGLVNNKKTVAEQLSNNKILRGRKKNKFKFNLKVS